jgi:hypothetical protein
LGINKSRIRGDVIKKEMKKIELANDVRRDKERKELGQREMKRNGRN